MNDHIWNVPAQRPSAAAARRTILQQHERIRVLLDHARAVAEHALDGDPQDPDAVASAIGDIHATLEIHLTFEEKVLVSFLEDDLPLGPPRAQALREEHAKQRATLSQIHREAMEAPLLPTLAAKLAFLTSWLLADMVEEERSLLTSEIIREDSIAVDQSDG
jgi:hypothetical protein